MGIEQAQAKGGRQGSMVRSTDFRRPVYCLLGIPIDALTKRETVERLRAAVASRLQCWLSTPNVQFLIATQSDAAFRNALIGGDVTVADGMPLVWIARLLGVPLKERVAGSDLFEDLLRGKGGTLKVYFFGGPDGVAEMACKRLNALSGPVSCVGFASPGFGSVEQMSSPEMIERINDSGADFVVVSLGSKKGQAWIERNRHLLTAPVVSHLGAVVNFVAGTIVRAPVWLQRSGLEWLWRIKEEPALGRRYWNDAIVLFSLVITRVLPGVIYRTLGFFGSARTQAKAVFDTSVSHCSPDSDAKPFALTRVALSGSWAESDIPLLRSTLESMSREPGDIEFDMCDLQRVNAAFIALLMLLQGHQAAIGRSFRILSPNPGLRRLLRLHCADFLLD